MTLAHGNRGMFRRGHTHTTGTTVAGAVLLAPGYDLASSGVITARLEGAIPNAVAEVLVLAEAGNIGGRTAELASHADHVLGTNFLDVEVSKLKKHCVVA